MAQWREDDDEDDAGRGTAASDDERRPRPDRVGGPTDGWTTVRPTIETERLLLRPWTTDDAALVRRLWLERDPRVPAHRRIGAGGRPTLDDIAGHIAEHPGPFVICEKGGGAVGCCTLSTSGADPTSEPSLAYELLREAHGRGIATEAAGALVARATEDGAERVHADVWAWNVASRRVLAKLGFRVVAAVADPRHGDDLRMCRDLWS